VFSPSNKIPLYTPFKKEAEGIFCHYSEAEFDFTLTLGFIEVREYCIDVVLGACRNTGILEAVGKCADARRAKF